MPPDHFLCSTCAVHFPTNSLRREHMREDWHVCNIKRKMRSWPPLSRQQYNKNVSMPPELPCPLSWEPSPEAATLPMANRNDDNHVHEHLATKDTTQCLFCRQSSSSVDDNILHMGLAHNFHLPNIERLTTDTGTLLSYLLLVIENFQSCIYCGVEKRSAEAVRTHMIDKGHCLLDLSPHSEILEFWESSASDNGSPPYRRLPGDGQEMMLASGRIIQSKAIHRASTKRSRIHTDAFNALALAPGETHACSHTQERGRTRGSSQSMALARRDAMGITGLSQQQQRALATRHQNLVSDEMRARNQARWALENMGNKVKQKHFKVGSMCRSGLFIDPTMR